MTAPVSSAPAHLTVPFLDLVAQHLPLEPEILAAVRSALRTASFVGGPEVLAFEREFAAFAGTSDAVGVNSGTDALRFAYLAMGIRPGDEIITVPNTFIATTEAMTQAGATIRYVDVEPGTLTMDPNALAAAVGPRTVGIVPVHLYGQTADMDPILSVARQRGLWVIEDACQAHGATYKRRPAGSMGVLGTFSFYPGKNLGACGEAGAVTGSHAEALATVRRLREHGQVTKYYHDSEGFNGRLDALQAAILRIKLRHLAEWNEARRRAAGWYRAGLSGIDDLTLPTEAAYATHVYHLFVVHTPERERLQAHLGQHGIGTGLHYPLPLHLQRAYAGMGYRAGQFPVTESAAGTLLSLPMYAELSEAQASHVIDTIRAFFGR
jgi:dTDP-4-amino-4,6-dideoxygalactose transaminase